MGCAFRPQVVRSGVAGSGGLIVAGRVRGATWAKETKRCWRGAGCASRGRFFAVILSAALSESTAYHCLECSLCVPAMTDLVQIPDHTLWLEYTCGNVVPVPVAAAMEKNLQTVAQVKRVARCAKCGARVKSDAYGLRIAWSLGNHRHG